MRRPGEGERENPIAELTRAVNNVSTPNKIEITAVAKHATRWEHHLRKKEDKKKRTCILEYIIYYVIEREAVSVQK